MQDRKREEPPLIPSPALVSSNCWLTRPKNGERQPETADNKKRKQQQQGTKRAAETLVEEAADESKADGKALAHCPQCMRQAEPLAAYPDDGLLDEQGAFHERTGEALPLDKVKKARGRELDRMLEHNVKKDISWAEAKQQGLRVVRSRWVDGWKPLPDDPRGVRSRCMAQEVNVNLMLLQEHYR